MEVWVWRLKRFHAPHYRVAGVQGNEIVVLAYGWSEKEAGREFLRRNLGRLRLIHLKAQAGRCGLCKRAVGLDLAHKVWRSERRLDTVRNTWLLCRKCHSGEHGVILSQRRP